MWESTLGKENLRQHVSRPRVAAAVCLVIVTMLQQMARVEARTFSRVSPVSRRAKEKATRRGDVHQASNQ